MKSKEQNKALGICSIVLAGISMIVSAIPFINVYTLYTAGVATILGAIGILTNSKHKKVPSIIGVALSITALFAGIIARATYVKDVEQSFLFTTKTLNEGSDTIEKQKSIVKEEKNFQNELYAIISKTEFKKVGEDRFGYQTYKAKIKNSTGKDISHFLALCMFKMIAVQELLAPHFTLMIGSMGRQWNLNLK